MSIFKNLFGKKTGNKKPNIFDLASGYDIGDVDIKKETKEKPEIGLNGKKKNKKKKFLKK